jgi:hypothetical protein
VFTCASTAPRLKSTVPEELEPLLLVPDMSPTAIVETRDVALLPRR